MATKSTSRKQLSPSKKEEPRNGYVAWQGFVNVYLTDKDKAHASEFYSGNGAVEQAIEKALFAGYRITLKHEKANNTFSAFMTHTDVDHPDSGWGLSERASSWWRALQRIMFIHHVVLQGDWTSSKGDNYVDDDTW